MENKQLQESFLRESKTGRQVIILRDIGKCSCVTEQLVPVPIEENKDGLFGEFEGLNLFDKKMEEQNIIEDTEYADPTCSKCLGTGRKLFRMISQKVRYVEVKALVGGMITSEKQSYELLKDGNLNFYLPKNYSFLSYKDYIAVPIYNLDNSVMLPLRLDEVYKVTDIVDNFKDEFMYYKITATKKKKVGEWTL